MTQYDDILSILDMYLGDIVIEVINKYKYPVVLDEEYYDILMFIYRSLLNAWFKGKHPDTSTLREKLLKARKQRAQLETLISYLVSRYIEQNGITYITR